MIELNKNDLYERIQAYFKFDKAHSVFVTILKSLILLLCGGYLSLIIRELNSIPSIVDYKHFGILVSGIFIFVYLEVRRLQKEKDFPVTILEHLKATEQLTEKIREVERKNITDTYIDNAITALNFNTCNYNSVNIENHLCDQSFEVGLKSVYHPFFNNPQNLLDTHKAKFTVGAFVKDFLTLPVEFNTTPCAPHLDHNIFISRDDLNFKDYFVKDHLTDASLENLSFYFQRQFLDTIKHNRFINETFGLDEQNEFTFISAPIPNVCENATTGVFFIISEKLSSIPSDFENLCQIFGRLFCNWLSKYNECIDNRCRQANVRLAEPLKVVEVQELRETINGVKN